MRIQKVEIKNFRALRDVRVDFSEVTTFVGPNGVGKSTVLKALDWFFNGKKDELTESDCSYGNTFEPISVQVTFNDLSDADREVLGEYVTEDSETFTAMKEWYVGGKESMSANALSFPDFTEIRLAKAASDKKRLYNDLREEKPELGLPEAKTGAAIERSMLEWESSNTDELESSPTELQTNFFGFNSQSVMNGLFDFVLVTADLRAGEETTDGKSSIIGKILEKTVDRSAADDEMYKISEEYRQRQQKVFDEAFGKQLKDLDKKLNDTVGMYAKGKQISVKAEELDAKIPKTTFGVSILDSDLETEIERQGHGFQRTLLISALQVLAESNESSDPGVICLAIEEPELYQHPIQERVFAKVLRELASNPERGIQVTYATHSPSFIESKHFDQIRRIVKHDDQKGVQIFSTSREEIKEKLTAFVKPSTVVSQLGNMARGTLSSAIFANYTLLVEGTSEVAIFYGIGDRERLGYLEASGLEIVPVGSKTNFFLSHAILSGLGIHAYVLFDGDAGGEERQKSNGQSDSQISKSQEDRIKLNRKLLKYFSLPEKDFPDQNISERVAVFRDHLETFLSEEWPEWHEMRTRFESEHNINFKKNHDGYRLVTLRTEKEPPDFLNQVIDRALGKTVN
ncbi:DUF2813 domain-containing protein [Corynebacterium sp. sy017]|uniref:ATP-dependent nuclease n=1 Tax=unclassified Corynebacterium TaxID=2624378 RepID=UPI001185E7EA|nr:AAA family ATPase [Corynebacterium sp. SY003]MBP3088485.1 DUF2813 domain-containing protein [Corynebacterium sp. sy017]TSD91791.1 DUF2813 domain-containing protein [Corynebacterium sp. SY003]